MPLSARVLLASWRGWWSPHWTRPPAGPAWLQLVGTGLFNTAIAVVVTLITWSFARRLDLGTAFTWNLVVSQCIGYTIHALFAAALKVLGATRIEEFSRTQRVAFYSLVPLCGVFIGYALGLTLLGVDVVRLISERPHLLVSIVLLSAIVSAGRRLRYGIDVPPELALQPVPPLLLQPLVENAIRHGLEPKLDGGSLQVEVRAVRDALELTVSDDGCGFRPGPAAGVGLSNLRERLAALFGDRARLAIEDLQPGTRVRITLPRAEAEPAA